MMKNKTDLLLKEERMLFHTHDLALLWGITERNTLLTTIKRYVKKGILYRIHKGFYSSIPPQKIEPEKLAFGALHRYGYLSTETILALHGVIHQEIKFITLVSSISLKFQVAGYACRVRKLRNGFLYNNTGITVINGVNTATVERAVADLSYFSPKYYLDANDQIDWKTVKKFQNEIGYL